MYEVPFTCLFTDQTLKQKTKGLTRHDGMVGLSQGETGLDRLVNHHTSSYLDRYAVPQQFF